MFLETRYDLSPLEYVASVQLLDTGGIFPWAVYILCRNFHVEDVGIASVFCPMVSAVCMAELTWKRYSSGAIIVLCMAEFSYGTFGKRMRSKAACDDWVEPTSITTLSDLEARYGDVIRNFLNDEPDFGAKRMKPHLLQHHRVSVSLGTLQNWYRTYKSGGAVVYIAVETLQRVC